MTNPPDNISCECSEYRCLGLPEKYCVVCDKLLCSFCALHCHSGACKEQIISLSQSDDHEKDI
jgi:hypothetical protein